ncbi:hypothetical protein F4778DRAFT_760060 [Xylariomycetidae sp. FL2044]|nr:hypothetical protein F4778DRAFT_760060 [Xylariomycetidae sp. FL2044]
MTTNAPTPNDPNPSDFTIISPTDDEEGRRFWLDRYKPFRLHALQTDPDAFGSTYARELAFTDETWLARLRNPSVQTFLAVRRASSSTSSFSSSSILSSVSLVGPLPLPLPLPLPTLNSSSPSSSSASSSVHEPASSSSSNSNLPPTTITHQPQPQLPAETPPPRRHDKDNEDENEEDNTNPLLTYQLNGIYTCPASRGRGLAKTLIGRAVESAKAKAKAGAAGRRPLHLSVVVYAGNEGAIGVYGRCGFVVMGGGGAPTRARAMAKAGVRFIAAEGEKEKEEENGERGEEEEEKGKKRKGWFDELEMVYRGD